MSQYQVLARKYRPKTFQEVIGQEPIVQTLKNAIKKSCTAHAYLFCGSRGTGKTTLARILAKALNCTGLSADIEPCNSCSSCRQIATGSSLDVLEIDGASNRGIEDIKTIAESVGYAPACGRWKIYIIDEVHMLTKEAFNALLKTLEEPPPNVKFFFATTEVQKIPATILSRCQRFNLRRLSVEAIVTKLLYIAEDLSIIVDAGSLARIATFAEGGFRDAESLFDQIIAFSDGVVSPKVVQDVLGLMPYEFFFELDHAVASVDIKVGFRIAQEIFLHGRDIHHFLEDLQRHFKAILHSQLSCLELIQELDPSIKSSITASSKIYTQEQCLQILEMIAETQSSFKTSISEQIALEALLIKIIRIRLRVPVEHLVKQLSQVEQRLTALREKQMDQPLSSSSAPLPPPPQKILETTDPAQEMRKKAWHDTVVQFAAVELDATVQRKPIPDQRRT